ncbi:hypothetical protein ACLMJK_004806 [Lecanora helva]
MAEGIGLGLGVVAAVIQTYGAITTAYDVYLDVKEFPSQYQVLRMGLLIERYRLELWANHVLSKEEQDRVKLSRDYWPLWKLFESIFTQILEAFQQGNQTMEDYGQHTGLPKNNGFSDGELLQNMALAAKSPPKHTLERVSRTVKFVLRDKRRIEQLIKKLSFWNDSLDKMTSRLEQESSRRNLRTKLSTNDTTQLRYLETAATIFKHPDIQRMASARNVIEQSVQNEKSDSETSEAAIHSDEKSSYRLEMDKLQFHGIPYQTDQVRAMARYGSESVIVDWRCCQDDSWRTNNPVAFQQRTANLTKILNSDLRPLSVSILHCVGYLNENSNVTGYAFRLPPDASPGQKPITLHQLLMHVKSGSQIPDLGERFELAKALVSTVFEIHNIGWMHKNIQPKNILFWAKPGTIDQPNVSKPYLMGFDISRPDEPGEMSEKPPIRPEDDLYRHPDYKGENAKSFRPSFDMYSLGVILFEIGLWRNVGAQRPRSPRPESDSRDPDFIEKNVMNGPVDDLRRFTGARYRDAVMSCLSRDFDSIWEQNGLSRQARLKAYLGQVQRKIVDAIARCSA